MNRHLNNVMWTLIMITIIAVLSYLDRNDTDRLCWLIGSLTFCFIGLALGIEYRHEITDWLNKKEKEEEEL